MSCAKMLLVVVAVLVLAGTGLAAQKTVEGNSLSGRWTRLNDLPGTQTGIAYQQSGKRSQLILQAGDVGYWLDLDKLQFRRLRTKLPAGKDAFELSAVELETPKDTCAIVSRIHGTPKAVKGMTYLGLNIIVDDGRDQLRWHITRFEQDEDDALAAAVTIGSCPPKKAAPVNSSK